MDLLKYYYDLTVGWLPAAGVLAGIAVGLFEWLKARNIWDPSQLKEPYQALPSGVMVTAGLVGLTLRQHLNWDEVLVISLANGLFGGQVFTLGVYHGAKMLNSSATKKAEREAANTFEAELLHMDTESGVQAVKINPDHVERLGNASRGAKVKLTLASLVAISFLGCGVLKSANDALATVCEGILAKIPRVEAKAQAEGVSPFLIAEGICMLYDGGKRVYELFTGPPEASGYSDEKPYMSLSAPRLEAATQRALAVAEAQGKLPTETK